MIDAMQEEEAAGGLQFIDIPPEGETSSAVHRETNRDITPPNITQRYMREEEESLPRIEGLSGGEALHPRSEDIDLAGMLA